ncbi:MAG TPA: YhbY family RNA-binding protein [Phycisphaerae bacterium]|nr:YhbY family RNA-binding protein [Phycisphaerae bacterium]
MTVSNAERQALKARAHRLKVTHHVGREGSSEAIVAGIRQAFAKTDLIKVRIRAEETAEVEAIAKSLAGAVPCELVSRTGFVAVLYRELKRQEDK